MAYCNRSRAHTYQARQLFRLSVLRPSPFTSGQHGTLLVRLFFVRLRHDSVLSCHVAPAKDDSHYSLEMSVSQFSNNLSNVHAQHFSMPYMTTPDYIMLQSDVYAATIHLHRDNLEIQAQSYQKCFYAANSMTALIRQLADNDYDSLCPIISVSGSLLHPAFAVDDLVWFNVLMSCGCRACRHAGELPRKCISACSLCHASHCRPRARYWSSRSTPLWELCSV